MLGVLRGFRVRINEQYGGNPSTVTVAPSVLSRMLTDLNPYTEYNVTVGAFTLAGETKSIVVCVRTPQDGRWGNEQAPKKFKTGFYSFCRNLS